MFILKLNAISSRLLARSFTAIVPYFPTGTMEREETEGQVATAKVHLAVCFSFVFIVLLEAIFKTFYSHTQDLSLSELFLGISGIILAVICSCCPCQTKQLKL